MKYLRQLLFFFIYSNLFIALISLLMVEQTTILFLGKEPHEQLMKFVFFATICSYNFHYSLTDHSVLPSARVAWIKNFRLLMILFFLAGLTGAAWYGWQLRMYWPWLIPVVAGTFLYSAPKIPHPLFHSLRKVAIGKTIFLAFIWMYVTALLPLIIAENPWSGAYTIYCISQFFFIYTICILFDYRDREDDKADGVRSLITYLNEQNIKRLFYGSFVIAAIGMVSLYCFRIAIWQIIVMLIPALIVSFLYKTATRNFSDLLYYFLLDGLMGLASLLMLLARI